MVDEVEGREASALNIELTRLLADTGRRMGFDVHSEYAVPGGRLDVVWTWSPPTPIPGVDDALPVVAFEIESSWRTRKHVQGDLLNLQDAAVALGVLVLAGADPRDDSLRRFATSLVDRPGNRVLVWTEDDVRALAAGRQSATAVAEAAAAAATDAPAETPPATRATAAASSTRESTSRSGRGCGHRKRRELRVTFTDVERVLGFPLPDSSRAHVAHWHGYQGSAVARAIIDAGWHASGVQLSAGTVTLSPGPPPGRR